MNTGSCWNTRGQMTIEMMLLAIIFVGVAMGVSNYAKSTGMMATLIESPWLPLQGMIEDGVWVKAGESKTRHPNLLGRHGTALGDDL